MKKEELAQLLNGRQIGEEMTYQEHLQARKNGLLVCYGYSYDLLEFRGIIYNRVSFYEGEDIFLYKDKDHKIGILYESDYDEIKESLEDYNIDFILPKIPIKIQWRPIGRACLWLITTDIPHATFDIYDDEDLYSRGIVLELTDIENYLYNKYKK
ncbi:hypothetical protein [Apibacter sp. wkB309]|uniref:hypothetical protein n=1 Tax=Apibacter sp. wkB309 TaxID=1679467 RepID=UPI000CF919F1|nr:hypothetical protein [Apibacter sp. wkB309]PQL89806.1 hypothetical protein C4S75_07395 [Apibacter sp. wkB309]